MEPIFETLKFKRYEREKYNRFSFIGKSKEFTHITVTVEKEPRGWIDVLYDTCFLSDFFSGRITRSSFTYDYDPNSSRAFYNFVYLIVSEASDIYKVVITTYFDKVTELYSTISIFKV